jgi:hypothetical protein
MRIRAESISFFRTVRRSFLTATSRKLISSSGGPETRIELCQGQTYDITSPIIFTAKNQEISTEGYPTDEALKARIVLQKDWTAGEGMLGGVRRGISGEGAAIMCVLSLTLSEYVLLISALPLQRRLSKVRTHRAQEYHHRRQQSRPWASPSLNAGTKSARLAREQ